MEKTKNLSMSPEEKAEIKGQEWLKKARGWIQKFLDDLVDMAKMRGELLEREPPAGWEKLLKKELIEGLDPDEDNQKRLQMLNELLNIPSEPFLKVLLFHNQQMNQAKTGQLEILRNQLSAQGFSGSALTPNLDRDPSWKDFLDQENKSCREKWRVLIDN
jgi:hypothetical protein